MTGKRRRFTAEFKKRVALDAFRGDSTVQALAAPNQVSAWKRQAMEGLANVFAAGRGDGGASEAFNAGQGARFTSLAFTGRVLASGAKCSMGRRWQTSANP